MTDLQIIQNDDGVFDLYDDTYDITIHCTSQEEQDEVLMKLNRTVCTDAISRQAALEAFDYWIKSPMVGYTNGLLRLHKMLEELPPVTPAEKVGHWIDAEVLDKIRAEIEGVIQEETVIDSSGGEYESIISKLDPDDVLQIIDKYKASPTGAESERGGA